MVVDKEFRESFQSKLLPAALNECSVFNNKLAAQELAKAISLYLQAPSDELHLSLISGDEVPSQFTIVDDSLHIESIDDVQQGMIMSPSDDNGSRSLQQEWESQSSRLDQAEHRERVSNLSVLVAERYTKFKIKSTLSVISEKIVLKVVLCSH